MASLLGECKCYIWCARDSRLIDSTCHWLRYSVVMSRPTRRRPRRGGLRVASPSQPHTFSEYMCVECRGRSSSTKVIAAGSCTTHPGFTPVDHGFRGSQARSSSRWRFQVRQAGAGASPSPQSRLVVPVRVHSFMDSGNRGPRAQPRMLSADLPCPNRGRLDHDIHVPLYARYLCALSLPTLQSGGTAPSPVPNGVDPPLPLGSFPHPAPLSHPPPLPLT
eukprot:scaffold1336_cov379-Prasinococcus_capsulatus_cf.AAC.3